MNVRKSMDARVISNGGRRILSPIVRVGERIRLPQPIPQLLLLGLLLLATSGANCRRTTPYQAPPQILSATPTLPDIIAAVNNNSQRFTALYTTDSSVSAGMTPSIKANLALQRQRQVRLRAETAITGPEVDLGSNDQMFWFWARTAQPAALYVCRHDQFHTGGARQFMPVEPEWLIDALGVPILDPTGQNSGPFPAGNGRLEIRTQLPKPEGMLTRVIVVEAASGWVLEQHLYDSQGTRLATSITSQHLLDPISGVTLPRHIEIEWPTTQLKLKLDLRTVQINQLGGDPATLFAMPNLPGYQVIDLGQTQGLATQPAGVSPSASGNSQSWRASTR